MARTGEAEGAAETAGQISGTHHVSGGRWLGPASEFRGGWGPAFPSGRGGGGGDPGGTEALQPAVLVLLWCGYFPARWCAGG
jgi:hypothetical protein